ncbi:hypothetical protein HRbin12_00340 [bacterium HR12]|nr:hypothetical protein HRbin12_00340 [bacterium HR12]
MVGLPSWRSADLSAPAAEDLPYPYCWPDAKEPPPSPTPWPGIPAEYLVRGDMAAGPEPVAHAIVRGSVLSWTTEPLKGPGWLEGEASAWVTLDLEEVLWVTPWSGTSDVGSLAGLEPGRYRVGPLYVRGDDPFAGTASLDHLVWGLREVAPDGTLRVSFVARVDGSTVVVFSGDPVMTKRNSLILQAFLEWSGYPLPSRDPLELLLAWSREFAEYEHRGVEPSLGPIGAAYQRFLAEVVMQLNRFPRVGTPEWWRAAPPECRNVQDAPPWVLEDLAPRTVFVRAERGWWEASDWALCLRVGLGDLGCSLFDAGAPSEYFRFPDVLVEPGGSIRIQIGKLLEQGGPSWVRRVDIGEIPWGTLASGDPILIDLNLAEGIAGYEQLQADPSAARVVVRILTPAEAEAIDRQIVEAQA